MATLTITNDRANARAPRESKSPHRRRGRSSWRLDSRLLFAGLLTNVSVSVLGAVLAVGGLRRLVPRSLPARA